MKNESPLQVYTGHEEEPETKQDGHYALIWVAVFIILIVTLAPIFTK